MPTDTVPAPPDPGAARPAGPTDRELVLAFRTGATVESRTNPRTGRAQYRVAVGPVRVRHPRQFAWQASEVRAWRGACVRLGLRIRRT
jgi:hypothetical protein